MIDPWTEKELEEIARLRNEGRNDSYIRGQMKIVRGDNNVPTVIEKESPMGTKKASKKVKSKKATSKKATSKVVKKPTRKKAKKSGGRQKGGFQVGENLTAVQGKDDSFYKQFPRYAAYQLICKKKQMKTADFVDAVEKLDGVKSRAQALGILTKLLEKECVKASGATKTTK